MYENQDNAQVHKINKILYLHCNCAIKIELLRGRTLLARGNPETIPPPGLAQMTKMPDLRFLPFPSLYSTLNNNRKIAASVRAKTAARSFPNGNWYCPLIATAVPKSSVSLWSFVCILLALALHASALKLSIQSSALICMSPDDRYGRGFFYHFVFYLIEKSFYLPNETYSRFVAWYLPCIYWGFHEMSSIIGDQLAR